MRPDRHSFVFLEARPLGGACGGEIAEIEAWRASGLPFVVASAREGDGPDVVRLGLATPDKRRIGFVADVGAIRAVLSPPTLREARRHAPTDWAGAVAFVEDACAAAGVEVAVFGSLAWTCRSGLGFLHAQSDLDLLLSPTRRNVDAARYAATRLAHASGLGPRLDGELLLADGSAINMREFAKAPAEILVKAHGGARLVPLGEVARLVGTDPA